MSSNSCTKIFEPLNLCAKTLKHIHFKGLSQYEQANTIQEYLVKKNMAHRDYKILEKNPRIVHSGRLPKVEPPAIYPTVLSFEFKSVYTGGKREKKHTGLRDIERMEDIKHVEFVQTNRGGQVTFHGPGQVVIYPILTLSNFQGLTSRCYISTLEKSIIGLLSGDPFHLTAKTTENTGVWVNSREIYNNGTSIKKISSIGVNVRRSVTCHGCSINCSTDLSYLNDPRFVMCGLPQFKQTSILNELGTLPIGLDKVADLFVKQIAKRLGVSSIETFSLSGKGPIESQFPAVDGICEMKK